MLQSTVDCLGRDEYVAHDLDNSISRNAILDRDGGEAVDLDLNEAAITAYVDAERLVLQ